MPDRSPPPSLPAETRLGRTALRVSDLDSMVEFYSTVVGLSRLERRDSVVTLGVGDTPLLVLRRDADAQARTRAQAGLFHNAFLFPSRTALGAALYRVRDRWQLDGASDHRVSEALYLSDPDGNGVELYRDRPRDGWPRSADGGVEMATLPLDLDAVAADSTGADTAPSGTSLGHVHLEVSSIAAARQFYVQTLGFDVQMDAGSALFVSAGGYHHHLGLNTWNGRSAPTDGLGLDWFEVVLPTTDAVSTLRDRLQNAGIAVSPLEEDSVSSAPGAHGLTVTDPDGIELRIRAP